MSLYEVPEILLLGSGKERIGDDSVETDARLKKQKARFSAGLRC
jgi:hypothetical protein